MVLRARRDRLRSLALCAGAGAQTVGFSNLTGGNRVLFASSMVVTQSAETVIQTLRERAAKIWNIDPEAVKWEQGAAHPVSPNAGQFEPLTLKELAEKAPAMGGPIGAGVQLNMPTAASALISATSRSIPSSASPA